MLAEYRPRLAFEGRANFLEPRRQQSVAAELSSLSAMLAAYVDLPGLGLPRLGPLAPFVGAGVGAARTRIGETRMTFPRTTTIVPGASRAGFAWMLTAGVAVTLDERMTLDLAWRYTDLGEDSLRRRGMDRQFHVGAACRRLRERGYSIPVRTFGPHFDDDTRTRIAGRIDSLIAQVGSVYAIHSLFRTMRETGKLHDGMWLFGNIPGAAHRVPHPAIPFGWLLSIALHNIHKPPSMDRPEGAWQSAVDIATDFAASMDCQRYNPYERFIYRKIKNRFPVVSTLCRGTQSFWSSLQG